MKHLSAIILFFLLLTMAPQPCRSDEEHRELSVASVVIAGARSVDENLIRQTMLTKGKAFFSWSAAPLDLEVLEGDLERIRELYRSFGYYDAGVTHALDTGEAGEACVVTVSIEEGTPIRVTRLLIDSPIWPDWLEEALGGKGEGNPRAGGGFRQLPLNEGDIFNAQAYTVAKKQLVDIFAEHGYGQAAVQGQARVYRQEHEVEIRLTVRPGRLFQFGEIRIAGNERTASRLIRREMDTAAGDVFSSGKLATDQRRLMGLDYFRVVRMEPQWGEVDEESVPLLVNVEEKPPRGAEFGIGYGTEEKLRVRSGIYWRNFLGEGYQLKLSGRVSDLGHNVESRFSDPYFLDRRELGLLYKLGYEALDLESYSNSKYYSNVRITRSFTPQVRVSVIHNLEENETTQLPATVSLKTIERYGRLEEDNFLISSLGGEIAWNSLDSMLNPTRGLYLSYGVEAAAGVLGSQIDFLRQDIRAHGYIPLANRTVFALRSGIGSIDPLQASVYIPIARRFFSGGSDSVRGYDYQELGVKDIQGRPVGGNSVLEGSAELRFPLVEDLFGAVFCDAGNVFNNAYNFNVSDLRYAAGAGLRYHTLIGPIRLDVGYQLNPRGIDGDRYRIHLNLGEVF